MLTNSSVKGARNCIDVSSKELARYWCKRFKKTKPEIEAAIAKVDNNAETVMKLAFDDFNSAAGTPVPQSRSTR